MPKARAAIIPVTLFAQNCTLLWCEASQRAAAGECGEAGADTPASELDQAGWIRLSVPAGTVQASSVTSTLSS